MRAVVDTNVVAYLLLGTESFVEEARRCIGRLDESMAPAVWEAELASVVWMAVRQGGAKPDITPTRQVDRSRLLQVELQTRTVSDRI